MDDRIEIRLRPDQLDDIVDALLAYADDCANDREILQSMERVDQDTVNDLVLRETKLNKLAALRRGCGQCRRRARETARTGAAPAAPDAAAGSCMRASGTTFTM